MTGPVPVDRECPFLGVRHTSDKGAKSSGTNHAAQSKTCTNHRHHASDNLLCSTTAVLCGLWLPLLVAPSAEVLFFVIFCGFLWSGARCRAECYFLMFFVVFMGVLWFPVTESASAVPLQATARCRDAEL
jgi:hypothetical protein